VCLRCGHPLLFEAARDPFAGRPLFAKKVRYLCGLLGHRVRLVVARNGFCEYACACGHTFLRNTDQEQRISHPVICVVAGHFLRYVTSRCGYAEYVCRNCGHPFCFVESDRAVPTPARAERAGEHGNCLERLTTSPGERHGARGQEG
jgi:hypothetical protein